MKTKIYVLLFSLVLVSSTQLNCTCKGPSDRTVKSLEAETKRLQVTWKTFGRKLRSSKVQKQLRKNRDLSRRIARRVRKMAKRCDKLEREIEQAHKESLKIRWKLYRLERRFSKTNVMTTLQKQNQRIQNSLRRIKGNAQESREQLRRSQQSLKEIKRMSKQIKRNHQSVQRWANKVARTKAKVCRRSKRSNKPQARSL